MNSLVSKYGNRFALGTRSCMDTPESPFWPVEQISWPGLEVGWPYNFYPSQNTFFSLMRKCWMLNVECWIYMTSKQNNKLLWTHYQASTPSIRWPVLLHSYPINSFHLSIILKWVLDIVISLDGISTRKRRDSYDMVAGANWNCPRKIEIDRE